MAAKKKTRANADTKARKSKAQPRGEAEGGSLYAPAGVFIVTGVLLAVFMYIDSGGVLGGAVKAFMKGLFGFAAYFVPPAFIGSGIYAICKKKTGALWLKLFLTMMFITFISALIHLSGDEAVPIKYAYSSGMYSDGGGVFGALIACPLNTLIDKIASYIVLILLEILLASLILGRSVISAVVSFIRGAASAVRDEVKNVESVDAYDRGRHMIENRPRLPKRRGEDILNVASEFSAENAPRTEELPTDAEPAADDPFADMLMDKKSRKRKKSKGRASDGDLFDDSLFEQSKRRNEDIDREIAEKKPGKNPFVDESGDSAVNAEEPSDDGIADIFSEMGLDISDGDVVADHTPDYRDDDSVMPSKSQLETNAPDDLSDDSQSGMTKKERQQAQKRREEMEEDELHRTIDEAAEQTPMEYIYPSTDLLDKPNGVSADMRREMFETSKKLISVLADFGVSAKLSQVTQGPSVTRYEIQPSSGVKLSKIVGLANDIALNLAVSNVLVAPVPGKAAVGIEIPNREVASVSIKEMLDSEEFLSAKSKLSVALGKDIGGRVVVGDIAKMPHVLIAGATGSGKSVCINTIITSIIYKASPSEVKLIMVDPKVVELGVYNGIPHLMIPVVTEPKKAAAALNWAVGEMMRRYELFAGTSVRNLTGYNSLMEKRGEQKLAQLVIIIDELADLMMVAAKEVEDYICRLAQLARAAGIHLIIATQRPSVDVITGLIKANIPSRIAFAVSSQVDSRTILDRVGAEHLLGRGDMLYFPTGERNPLRVQGAFVSDDEIERIVDFLKETGDDSHYSEDLEDHIERCAAGENGVTPDKDDDGDELLPDAIRVAVELGQISTAMIQRKLKVGYSRAGRIIDQMEERGIISGANGSKPRQVYMSRAEMMGIDSMNDEEDS